MLAGCGGEPDPPPAQYELFTFELVGIAEGERVFPGQKLGWRVRYQGDLVRNLRITPTYTHEDSGETEELPFLPQVQNGPDVTSLDERGTWVLDGEFLKKAGPIRIQLQASVLATRRGSTPWVAESQSVYVELQPRLDTVKVQLPNQPAPYATPIDLEVTGADLWGDVDLTVTDFDTGETVPGLEKSLTFDGSRTSVTASWILRVRALERVGTRRLALVARYGELQAVSAPFTFEVTHTIDQVLVLLRRSSGSIVPASSSSARLSDVEEIIVRVKGTKLAGHAVTVNDRPPMTAGADEEELARFTPRESDFEDGKGTRTWDFVVRSGGMERSASVTLQRWGIEDCGWWTAAGQRIGEGETVAIGTQVSMRATLWGFPDTTTILLVFRSPLADFTIWERDPGGRVDPVQKIDPISNNDDKVKSFAAEIHSDQTERGWTVKYDEEFGIVLDPIHLNAAEYYFEVTLEDQVCTSGEIWVYPE